MRTRSLAAAAAAVAVLLAAGCGNSTTTQKMTPDQVYLSALSDISLGQAAETTSAQQSDLISFGRHFCNALKSGANLKQAENVISIDGLDQAQVRLVVYAATASGSLCPVKTP